MPSVLPLCLISCHYAFSSSPYALCLATMPSAMPYILPLCLQFFPYALYLATMPSVLPPMPYVLPLCLQLCLISCHYAFSSSPLCLATMPSAIPYILPLCLTGGWLLHILHDGLASLAPMPLMNPGENPAHIIVTVHPHIIVRLHPHIVMRVPGRNPFFK